MATINAAQVKGMLISVADRVIASKEMLCDADRNIGDGDHGIGMAKGFEAARRELMARDFTDVYTVFSTVGRTMIREMGGASGIIFGLLFYAGAKNQQPKEEVNTQEFTEVFEKALNEIQLKGQAKPGDKTIVDGLVPMVEVMKSCSATDVNFKTLLSEAVAAAKIGKENSKNYVARYGKAKTLGDRSIGFPDPGCVSLVVIADAMFEWAQENL